MIMKDKATLVDSTYDYSVSDFREQFKLVYGEFDYNDSTSLVYSASNILCNDAILKAYQKCKVEFSVNVDTSYLQVNNSSRTFLIDVSKVKLETSVTDETINYSYTKSRCFDIKDEWKDRLTNKARASKDETIKSNPKLTAAQAALDKILSNQMLILIQSGYENKAQADDKIPYDE